MRRDIGEFEKSLEKWVKMQEAVLRLFEEAEERVANSDRLEIINSTRTAFNHLIRTLKAFDQWLQDPFIATHIPHELLVEVWRETVKALKILIALDIRHTSEVKNIISELYYEGKLNPIVSQLRLEITPSEEDRGGGPSLSI